MGRVRIRDSQASEHGHQGAAQPNPAAWICATASAMLGMVVGRPGSDLSKVEEFPI
jgi:hypothetical protein